MDQVAEMVPSVSARLKVTDDELIKELVEEANAQVLDYTGQKN